MRAMRLGRARRGLAAGAVLVGCVAGVAWLARWLWAKGDAGAVATSVIGTVAGVVAALLAIPVAESARRAVEDARRRALLVRPVPLWTPEQLGVHRAIAGSEGSGDAFVVPQYIARPHDQELAAVLHEAARGGSVQVVVVRGGSCSGKTRAAVHALDAMPPR